VQVVIADVSQAFTKSGIYTLVSSANQADLILALTVDFYGFDGRPNDTSVLLDMRVQVIDPVTKTILWDFTSRYIPNRPQTDQITDTLPYFLKDWNTVIGKGHI
jgi:hypothetical protein